VPEISPDGALVSYISDFGSERQSIRAVALASGAPAEFSHLPRISVSMGQGLTTGRHRWLPDGRGLIYLGLDDRDRSGLYELVFDRSSATAPPTPYFGFELDRATESFALSPDGKRLVVAQWEQQRSLLLVEGIPSIEHGGKMP
ncbi:MAG: hypothetical protein NDJ75_09950, partial [Thermoanaerobaculia bacterium]|nr:hypothetical protein [Thermoanaerobaculia bacterium]